MTEVEQQVRTALTACYEEVMWLAKRPNITPSMARGWYTHIVAESVKRKLRRFTGRVSRNAVTAEGEPLMLEHFLRIQTTLTTLVKRHLSELVDNPNEFVDLVIEFEQVHVVTRHENYSAMRAKGDYASAKIDLVPWFEIPTERQHVLWHRMLRGRVANAADFRPSVI
jgi:hypothetical protein